MHISFAVHIQVRQDNYSYLADENLQKKLARNMLVLRSLCLSIFITQMVYKSLEAVARIL